MNVNDNIKEGQFFSYLFNSSVMEGMITSVDFDRVECVFFSCFDKKTRWFTDTLAISERDIENGDHHDDMSRITFHDRNLKDIY